MAEPFEPRFPDVIDSTMREDFVSCPQQFYQGYILCRAQKGGSVHLVAGAAFAKGLEIARRKIWGPEKLSLEDALIEAIPHALAEYGDYPVPAGFEHKSPERVVQGLVAYFDRFPPQHDHIQPFIRSDGQPAVEFTFSFPTQIRHPDTGDPILYAGRFDFVGVYNELLWVVDDKTATQLGPSWIRSFNLRAQLTGYAFAARQYGIPVEGAIVRGISFLKSGAYGFAEPIEYRNQWELERWFIQLHRDIARMVSCWQDKSEDYPYGYWDWNLGSACTAYGGCAFAPLCTVKEPEAWAQQDYERRIWNPLDVNPAGKGVIKVPPTTMES